MLGATIEDIRTAAGCFERTYSNSVSVVMGPPEVIEKLSLEYGKEIKDNTIVLPV